MKKLIQFFFILLCCTVLASQPVCQYNEDCPPDKLCDRLNRICINPCFEDSCGDNAQCIPVNHGIDCSCIPGHQGNPYIECAAGEYKYYTKLIVNKTYRFIIIFNNMIWVIVLTTLLKIEIIINSSLI